MKIPQSRQPWFAIALIALAAAVFRLWGIGWSLPLKKAHIDEAVVIFYTMRFFSGDLNPHIFFDYPTLFLYILGLVFFGVFGIGRIIGVYPSLDAFISQYMHSTASPLYYAGRLVSVICAVATVVVVWRIAREHFRSRGAWAALACALAPAHVLHSHYATVDVACVFLVMLSFLYVGRYLSDPRRIRELYRGSLFLGFAAAAKYYPVFFLLPLSCAIVWLERPAAVRRIAAATLLVAAGFVIGCPYAVLDFPAFAARFIDRFNLVVWNNAAVIAAPAAGVRPWAVIVHCASAMTAPLFIMLLIGIVLAWRYADRNERSRLAVWLLFPALFAAFLATWRVSSPHYALVLVPFISLLGAAGWEKLIERYALPRWVVAASAAAIFALPVVKDVRIGRMLTRADTRLEALAWMRQNVEPGSTVLRFAYTPEFLPTDPFSVRVDWENKLTGVPAERFARDFRYIVTSAFDAGPRPAWEEGLLAGYSVAREWQYVPFAQFHHPRVTVYKRKD